MHLISLDKNSQINGDKGSNVFILDAQSLRTKLETESMVLREKTENLRRLESDYEMLEKRFDKEKHALEDTISCKDQEILLLKVVPSEYFMKSIVVVRRTSVEWRVWRTG